jgi:hypothetical protein
MYPGTNKKYTPRRAGTNKTSFPVQTKNVPRARASVKNQAAKCVLRQIIKNLLYIVYTFLGNFQVFYTHSQKNVPGDTKFGVWTKSINIHCDALV